MSINTKLDLFTLKIREKGNKNNFLNFNDIAGFKLLNEVAIYLKKNMYLFNIDKINERTSRIEKNILDNESLYCRIKVGKFGESSEIINTLSGSGVFYKEREHSDTIPLFFHLKISNDGKKALIHIERYAKNTLLPEIKNILNSVLENLRTNQFIFEIKPLKTNMSLSYFIEQKRGYISLINFALKDSNSPNILEPPIITIKTKPRKRFPEKIVKKIIEASKSSNYRELKALLSPNISSLKIDRISIVLKVEGSNSIKVNLEDEIEISNTINIEPVKDDQDKFGHPKFNYLKIISLEKMLSI